ncbi:ABC transporter permease [Isachenkonia alkalipeptolytica]|uniref:ABC transporter permease n=1 Tax=Isachenkonia alkalipeptolytica TaxID=2565777 RepID=A0AA44BDA8_9CLOT|nr:ABC transporter permease [Isachenkonia alkalipeptolytica]NBG88139.1 ABC transporter permease [Isachenkonia alkalipeptolytica]
MKPNRRKMKLSQYAVTILLILTLNFFLPRLMPGDPFTVLSADEGEVHTTYSEEDIQRYRAYYGLDRPLVHQYASYMIGILQGDLGYSIQFKQDVGTVIFNRLPWTLFLVGISVGLSALIGVFFGVISGYKKNTGIDQFLYSFFITLSEIPGFMIGLLLLFFFGAYLNLFPLSGGMTHFRDYASRGEQILDILHHSLLPITALTITGMGGFYLIARNTMVSIIDKPYMMMAKAKGLSRTRILFYHGLKNAFLPIVTRIFLSFGQAMGGALLVENVFNYPGIGRLMREAVTLRDYPLIQGVFIFMTLFVLSMNYLSDVIYKRLDPRVI